jgi:hypothetical protein
MADDAPGRWVCIAPAVRALPGGPQGRARPSRPLAALGIVDTERLARSIADGSTRGVWPALNVDVWLRARLEAA